MECKLFTLPEDVFYRHILPLLKLHDLLRLRRVSKQMKIYSDDHIRTLRIERVMEINEENDHPLEDFLRLGLPASTICINNRISGESFFQNPALEQFLQLHSSTVCQMRVAKFYICNSEEERRFYSSLSSLQSLTIDTIQLPTVNDMMSTNFHFPATIKNLKTLKITNIVCGNSSRKYIKKYILALLGCCSKLEFLCLPRHNGSLASVETLKWARGYLNDRNEKFPNAPNLKFYDLFHHDQHVSTDINFHLTVFLLTCYEFGVKVLRIGSNVLDPACFVREDEASSMCATVVSMANILCSIFSKEMPAMESLYITSTSRCSFGQAWSGNKIPQWPCLKTLEIRIDSAVMQIFSWNEEPVEQVPTSALIQFLTSSVHRENLKELAIEFRGEVENLPCPRAHDIVRTCGNLTKLHLVNWIGTNKAVSTFWAGLPHLEEVILNRIPTLGNVAFVGADKEDPTFLKLTKLRKFMLDGVEFMPKITDLVFELVFRHLKIKQFYLCCDAPIKSVTIKGIRSLLTGEFNNHVERFPFRLWTLENASKEELALLESEFRASHMM